MALTSECISTLGHKLVLTRVTSLSPFRQSQADRRDSDNAGLEQSSCAGNMVGEDQLQIHLFLKALSQSRVAFHSMSV